MRTQNDMLQAEQLRQRIQGLLLQELNTCFRDFSSLGLHWFPPDEFSAEEAEQLLTLCQRVSDNGYEFIRQEAQCENGKCELDLLSSHLALLGDSCNRSVFGIAIAAEMFLEPLSDQCYASKLNRTIFFLRLTPEEQCYIVDLFYLARYVRGLAFSREIQVFGFLEKHPSL